MKPFIALAAIATLASAQFVPNKPVVIHPAVESKAEHVGSIEGPPLGKTPPAPPPSICGSTTAATRSI